MAASVSLSLSRPCSFPASASLSFSSTSTLPAMDSAARSSATWPSTPPPPPPPRRRPNSPPSSAPRSSAFSRARAAARDRSLLASACSADARSSSSPTSVRTVPARTGSSWSPSERSPSRSADSVSSTPPPPSAAAGIGRRPAVVSATGPEGDEHRRPADLISGIIASYRAALRRKRTRKRSLLQAACTRTHAASWACFEAATATPAESARSRECSSVRWAASASRSAA